MPNLVSRFWMKASLSLIRKVKKAFYIETFFLTWYPECAFQPSIFKGITMADSTTTLKELKAKMAAFVKERDWEKFHSPKNLSMSIAIEAAELMEHFQWCDVETSKEDLAKNRQEVTHEIADILCYLLSFCNMYDIDISQAVSEKIALNAAKYPAAKVHGSYEKYKKVKKSIKKSTKKR